MTLPSTMEDACVSVGVGSAVRDVVDPLVDGVVLDEHHRVAAEVIVASIFMPLLAREDRIAAYLGRPALVVGKLGFRLRRSGIWVGRRLASDCYDMILDPDPLKANVSLSLLAGAAMGSFHAFRDPGGVLLFSNEARFFNVHFEAAYPCRKCWTTRRYGQTGKCVECQRRYMRRYFGRRETLP